MHYLMHTAGYGNITLALIGELRGKGRCLGLTNWIHKGYKNPFEVQKSVVCVDTCAQQD